MTNTQEPTITAWEVVAIFCHEVAHPREFAIAETPTEEKAWWVADRFAAITDHPEFADGYWLDDVVIAPIYTHTNTGE